MIDVLSRSRALAYYYKNRDKCLERAREYRVVNKDYYKAYSSKYQKDNNVRINARQRKGFGNVPCVLCGTTILNRGGAKYCVSCKMVKQVGWARQNRIRRRDESKGLMGKIALQRRINWGVDRQRKLDVEECIKGFKQRLRDDSKGIDKRHHKKLFKENCPEAYRLVCKRTKYNRRAREKKVTHSFTAEQWLLKRKESLGICPMCNLFVGVDDLTLDHIIPLSKVPEGFDYSIDDVQPLCHLCNSTKRDN